MRTLMTILPWLIGAALAGTLATLMAGLLTMTRGDVKARLSNRMMRARVAMQAITIALIVVYFVLMRTTGG
jgi:Hypoxia induced protein conserved region